VNGASVTYLLDTQILVWIAAGSKKLSAVAGATLLSGESELYISAATAWEYSDLLTRKRLPVEQAIDHFVAHFGATVIDLPANIWRIAATLPDIHRDPVDRMLVAHAIIADMTLVTADEAMQRYPVKILW
jgi:PIN domain nuclease of toxin-antitoxin system